MEDSGLTVIEERRTPLLPWVLFAASLAIAAWALWQPFGPEDHGDPLATSLAAFEKQNWKA